MTDYDVEENSKKEQIAFALNRAYFFLKFRPRSKKEVIDYLQKKATTSFWSAEIIPEVISHLEELHYINDEDFIRWFVEQRNHAKPKSQFALQTELMRFGIDKDLIKQYFEENEHNEEELALSALRKRWRRFQLLDKKTRFEKAANFLAARGFGFSVIKKTINHLEEGGV